MATIRSLSDLRAWYGDAGKDLSDEQMMSGFAKASGIDPAHVADQFGYDPGSASQTGERATAAGSNYVGNLQGAGAAVARGVGLTSAAAYLDRKRQANDFQGAVASQRAKNLGAVEDTDDIHGVGDAANYVGGLAIGAAPYIAEGAADAFTGGAVSEALMPLRGARAAARLAEGGEAYASAATRAASIARPAAVGAGSYPSSVGMALQGQREQNGSEDLTSAALAGAGISALNILNPTERIAARLPSLAGTAALDGIEGVKGGLARTAANAGIASAEQAAVMGGQAALTEYARTQVDPNEDPTGDAAMKRYKESLIGGAALGGAARALHGGWRRKGEAPGSEPSVEDQPDLLQRGLPESRQIGYDPTSRGEGAFVAFPDGSVATGSDQELMHRYNLTPETLSRLRDEPQAQAPAPANAELPGPQAPSSVPGTTLDRQGAIDAAAREYQGRRQMAHDDLVDNDAATGKPAIQMRPQDVALYHDMVALNKTGRLSDETFTGMAGTIKEALRSEDRKAINVVRKAVETIKSTPEDAARAPGAEADRAAAPVADRPAAVAGDLAAGSGVPVGVDRGQPAGPRGAEGSGAPARPDQPVGLERQGSADTVVGPKPRFQKAPKPGEKPAAKTSAPRVSAPAETTFNNVGDLARDIAKKNGVPEVIADAYWRHRNEGTSLAKLANELSMPKSSLHEIMGRLDEKVRNAELTRLMADAPDAVHDVETMKAPEEHAVEAPAHDQVAEHVEGDGEMGEEANTSGTLKATGDLVDEANRGIDTGEDNHLQGLTISGDHHGEGETKANNDLAADKAYKKQRTMSDATLKARWDSLTEKMARGQKVEFSKLGEGQKLMFEEGIKRNETAETHLAVSESVTHDKMRFSDNSVAGHGAFEVHGATGDIHGVDTPTKPSEMHGEKMDAVKAAHPALTAMTEPHNFDGKHDHVAFSPLKPSQRYSIAAGLDTLSRSALAPMAKLAQQFVKRIGVFQNEGKYKTAGAQLAPDGTLGFGDKYLPRDLLSHSIEMVQHLAHEFTHALDRIAGKEITGHSAEASLLPGSPSLADFDIKGFGPDSVVTPKFGPVMDEVLSMYRADKSMSDPAMADFDQALMMLRAQLEALEKRGNMLGKADLEDVERIFEIASTELTPKLLELYAANPEGLQGRLPLAYNHAEALAKASTPAEAAAVFQGKTHEASDQTRSPSQDSAAGGGHDRPAGAASDAAGDRGVHGDVSRGPDAAARNVGSDLPGSDRQVGGEGQDRVGSDLDGAKVRNSSLVAPPAKAEGLVDWVKSQVGGYKTHPSLLGWLTTEQLGHTFKNLPAVAAFSQTMQRMGGSASKMMHVSNDLVRQWSRLENTLGTAEKAKFDALLNRTTRTQIWPDRGLDHPSQAHLDRSDAKVIAEHRELSRLWASTPAEYRKMFTDVQADHAARFERYAAAQRQLIVRTFYPETAEHSASVASKAQVDAASSLKTSERAAFMEDNATSKTKADTFRSLFEGLDAQEKISRLVGPYAPQSRFGDHIVSYKAPEYQRAEKLLEEANSKIQALHEGDHTGQLAELDASIAGDTAKLKRATTDARREQLRQDIADSQAERAQVAAPMDAAKALLAKRTEELNAMKSDVNAYNVEFFENRGQAMQRHEQLKAFFGDDGTEVKRTMRDQFLNDQDAITPAYIKRIEEHLTHSMTGANADEIRRTVREMYLQHLPGTSVMKSQLKRKNVPGIKDAEASRSFAAKAMKDAYGISRLEHSPDLHDHLSSLRHADDEDSKLVGNELAKRMAQNYTANNSSLINFASNLTYAMQLGLSPSFMLMQGTQQWVITAPIMAARHGIAKTSALLSKGTGDASKMVKLAWDKSTDRMTMQVDPEASVKAGIITPAEGKLLREMMDQGRIDITSQHDLGIATTPSNATDHFTKASQFASWPATQLETINRISTALAGYRAEKDSRIKGGATVAEAEQKAHAYADKLVSETHMNYNTENRARFLHPSNWGGWGKLMFQFRGYQQGMAYLTARNMVDAVRGDKEAAKAVGYLLGVQMATAGTAGMPIPGASAVIASMLYKSFSKDDEEKDLKEQFYQGVKSMGGESMARFVTGGLPALAGVNVASKIGMNNTFDVAPFVQTNGKNGKDSTAAYFLAAAGGPTGGQVANWVDAMQMVEHGDYAKAAMASLPKALADIVKAYEYQAHGTSDKRGNTILKPEDISGAATALRALGLQSEDVQRTMDQRSAFFEARQNRNDVRSKILADFARASLQGDDTAAIRQEAIEFSQRHPDDKIAPGQLQLAIVKRKAFERNLKNGVPVGKRDQALAKDVGVD